MSIKDKDILSENYDENFGTLYNYSFYDINKFYSQLEDLTLYDFQTQNFGSDDEHIKEFSTLSGYPEDEMILVNIKEAVKSKILSSQPLIAENIKKSNDKNAVTIMDYGATLCLFNPVQFLIENSDILIAAYSYLGNKDVTEENLQGLIKFATRHILCCPNGEPRTWLPKTVVPTSHELYPSKGSDLDDYTYTSEMRIPFSSFYKKILDEKFEPNEKTVEFNLNHSDRVEGLYFKFGISGYQLTNGSYNYYFSIFSNTPGQNESSLEMFSVFKNVSSNFMEALYHERHQMIFNITKSTGNNQILTNGYGRIDIIEDKDNNYIRLRLYRGLQRSIETLNFVYNYYMKGLINRLDEIKKTMSNKGDLSFDNLYNNNNVNNNDEVRGIEDYEGGDKESKDKKKKRDKKDKKDDDEKFIFDENNFSFQLNSECLCFQANSDICIPPPGNCLPPVVQVTPHIEENEHCLKKNPLYFLMN